MIQKPYEDSGRSIESASLLFNNLYQRILAYRCYKGAQKAKIGIITRITCRPNLLDELEYI